MAVNREDMLELTRRMTLSRNCFSRIAGAYLDEEGFVDGTFNRHFKRLTQPEQQKNLELAKTVPFAQPEEHLKEYRFSEENSGPGSVYRFLQGLKESELKNDAMLDVFYEVFGEKCRLPGGTALFFFFGTYDIPRKGKDHESQWESEESFPFLVCTVSPVAGDYEPGEPEYGFLYPAYKNRCAVINMIQVYRKRPKPERCAFLDFLLLNR